MKCQKGYNMVCSIRNYPIKNTRVYKFADGMYYVSFDTRNTHEKFYGTRQQIAPQMALRLKRVLHVR